MTQRVANDRYRNDWFKKEIGAGKVKQVAWYFVNVFFFINPLNPGSGIKRRLLRYFGARIGSGVILKPGINIKYPWKLVVGDHSWIGEKVWIDNLGAVEIGSHVCLSQGAMLLTGNHDYTKMNFDLIIKKIVLEDGVWIGAHALVCPGVVAGSHAVVTAKSVVTGILKPYGIYRGNPAVYVKDRIIKNEGEV